jgi:hypothetical protein
MRHVGQLQLGRLGQLRLGCLGWLQLGPGGARRIAPARPRCCARGGWHTLGPVARAANGASSARCCARRIAPARPRCCARGGWHPLGSVARAANGASSAWCCARRIAPARPRCCARGGWHPLSPVARAANGARSAPVLGARRMAPSRPRCRAWRIAPARPGVARGGRLQSGPLEHGRSLAVRKPAKRARQRVYRASGSRGSKIALWRSGARRPPGPCYPNAWRPLSARQNAHARDSAARRFGRNQRHEPRIASKHAR